jgi:hypothetical protein
VNAEGYARGEYQAAVRSLEAADPVPIPGRVGEQGPASRQYIRLAGVDADQVAKMPWLSSLRDCIAAVRDKEIVQNAIVHGSYGDYTYTPFSDLEITLVLCDGTAIDRRKLDELRRWRIRQLNPLLVHIDPLQHHGPFYVWPELLRGYDESILPISCYQSAWALDPIDLEFTPYMPATGDPSYPLLVTLTSLASFERNFFRFGLTPYSIKRLLSNVMLVPAFLFQSKSHMCTKKEAIDRTRELGVRQITDVIDFSTQTRASWPETPGWLGSLRSRFISSQIPSGRLDQYILSLYRRPALQDSVKRDLLPKIPGFCQEITRLYGSNSAL